jgi:PAS domain S-box-containing protein
MLELELFELLQSTADAAFTITECGEILSWNAAAENLFGYTAAEVVGRQCYDVLDAHGQFGNSICMRDCAVQRCARHAGPVPSFDMQTRTSTGTTVWVNVSTLSYRNPRTGRVIIGHIARDITAQKEKQRMIEAWVEMSKRVAAMGATSNGDGPQQLLSPREIRVLQLLAEPQPPEQVATILGIAPATLRNHLHRINEKLGTKDRLGAVLQAMHRGLI